jgi:hypothetical protein
VPVLAAFTAHPRESGQTYRQHCAFALYVAGQALMAAVAAAVHAVLPFLFQHTAGTRLLALAERIRQARGAGPAPPTSRTDASRV